MSDNQADNLSELMPLLTDLYREWCRLKGYSLGKTPIEISIDTATGYEAARMREFIVWLQTEIFTRLPEVSDLVALGRENTKGAANPPQAVEERNQ